MKVILLILVSASVFPLVKNLNTIKKKDLDFLKQIKVEKSSLMVLEQYLEKNESYNKKDSYAVSFICNKKRPSKIADCEIVKYEVLKPSI